MSPKLTALIEKARHYVMTPEERREQAISFAYGNVHYSNPSVTREDVEKAAMRIDRTSAVRLTVACPECGTPFERVGESCDRCERCGMVYAIQRLLLDKWHCGTTRGSKGSHCGGEAADEYLASDLGLDLAEVRRIIEMDEEAERLRIISRESVS